MGQRTRARLSGCLGKVRHDVRESAQAHLYALWKRFRYKGRVYHCSFCRGWHVGRHHRKRQ